MAVSRYDNRKIGKNISYKYRTSSLFNKRGLKEVEQYQTAHLKYPESDTLSEIIQNTRVWAPGTKYFTLAGEFYGNPEYWWVIAWFNLRPLETDWQPGDIVIIPTPLETVLSGFDLL